MSCLFSLGQGGAFLEANFLNGERLDTSKSMITVKKSSHRESVMESSMKPQSSAMSDHSSVKGSPKVIREWLMSLQRDSHVSRSQLRGFTKQKTTNAISGRKPSRSFAEYDHNSHCWRTYQASFITNTLAEYSETWPKWGSMQNGVVSRHAHQRIVFLGLVCGCWPRPGASDGTFFHMKPEWELETVKKHKARGVRKGTYLRCVTATEFTASPTPTLAETLMTWPIGQSALKPLEMGKFREWLKQHGVS